MMKHLICTILILSCAFCWPGVADAKKKVVDIYDLTLDENLQTPEIKNDKVDNRIKAFQLEVALAFKKAGTEVELMRDEEVIVLTFSASELFNSNDTVLTDVGKKLIRPITRFLNPPGLYKVLLVMHSDNTGSDKYQFALTSSRMNAVFDWIDANASTDFVVPYALGGSDPIWDNNSMAHRKLNRRLEVYLIPDEAMIELAKKGKLDMRTFKTNKKTK